MHVGAARARDIRPGADILFHVLLILSKAAHVVPPRCGEEFLDAVAPFHLFVGCHLPRDLVGAPGSAGIREAHPLHREPAFGLQDGAEASSDLAEMRLHLAGRYSKVARREGGRQHRDAVAVRG